MLSKTLSLLVLALASSASFAKAAPAPSNDNEVSTNAADVEEPTDDVARMPPTDHLEYGRCYRISNTNGVQYGLGPAGAEWYTTETPNKDIPFRVCHSLDNCLQPGRDQHVPTEEGRWYLLDPKGSRAAPGPAWVGNWDFWLATMPKAFDHKFIAKFKFSGEFTCLRDEYCHACINISDHYENWNGLFFDTNRIAISNTNQQLCVDLQFTPVPCLNNHMP